MSYAIKIDIDNKKVILSKSIIEETKRISKLNFAFFPGGFSFYFSRKGRDKSAFNYKIDKTTHCIEDEQVIVTLASSLNIHKDWIVKTHKGELVFEDKCNPKKEYIIYLEKVTDGCFRTLCDGKDADIRNYLNGSRRSNLLVTKEGDIKAVYSNRYQRNNTEYNNEKYFSANYNRWQGYFECSRKDYLGNRYNTCIAYPFLLLTKKTALQYSSCGNKLLYHFPKNIDYLYPDLEIVNDEIYVTFLAYGKLLDLYYREGFRINLASNFLTSGKRQSIKLTKYIQSCYPNKSSEQVKEEYNKIAFMFKKIKPEIKEVKGDDIIYWYDEENYLTSGGNSNVLYSCMRYKKFAKALELYSKNSNVSLLIMTVGDKLVGRALIWNCTDGTRIMDRPYIIRDEDYILFEEYRKNNNILFIYDYRIRNGSGKGYGVGQFLDKYTRNFSIQLEYVPTKVMNYLKDTEINKLLFADGSCDIPYLDNFSYFDIYRKTIFNACNLEEYKANHPSYFICSTSGAVTHIRNGKILIDGTKVNELYAVYSKYHNGYILKSSAIKTKDGYDYILAFEQKKLDRKASEIQNYVLNNEELEYVNEVRIA